MDEWIQQWIVNCYSFMFFGCVLIKSIDSDFYFGANICQKLHVFCAGFVKIC